MPGTSPAPRHRAPLPAPRIAVAGAAALLAACAGEQSSLDPRGPAAAAAAEAWWVMLVGASAIFALVMGLVIYATLRAPERRPRLRPNPFILVGGLLFPITVLTALLIYGTTVGRRMVFAGEVPTLRIEVTGHQWWWEVRYPADAERGWAEAVTANELWLPVGELAEITVRSVDVIHSFWIPQLGGKLDMIPGRDNTLRLMAEAPGEFRGQCAEFCGAQHALMSFVATAAPMEEFEAWRRSREVGGPAAAVPAGAAALGDAGCAACHQLPGGPAPEEAGPDLRHVGARAMVLGRRGFDREYIGRFLTDPQRVKPGNRGHLRGVGDDEVDGLLDAMETLR
ncbi:cytochrome c oxidase subunit II [Coralloluteibacterium thermophilus]|uniref:Cytochrome aa3 subunit 2 n=1 Tax=Coralloluteibacterium thermophilum TaxID=2707049 RepID=A0ABV9NK26_9GAMM